MMCLHHGPDRKDYSFRIRRAKDVLYMVVRENLVGEKFFDAERVLGWVHPKWMRLLEKENEGVGVLSSSVEEMLERIWHDPELRERLKKYVDTKYTQKLGAFSGAVGGVSKELDREELSGQCFEQLEQELRRISAQLDVVDAVDAQRVDALSGEIERISKELKEISKRMEQIRQEQNRIHELEDAALNSHPDEVLRFLSAVREVERHQTEHEIASAFALSEMRRLGAPEQQMKLMETYSRFTCDMSEYWLWGGGSLVTKQLPLVEKKMVLEEINAPKTQEER